MRRIITVLVALCLTIQCLLPALAFAQETETARQGRVNADRLNIREGAGTQFPVVGAAARGDAVVILEESESWYRVRLADGRTGWVAARYVEVVAAAPSDAEGDEVAAPSGEARRPEAAGGRSGGGSLLRSVLKWGCFFGAAAGAGLAYNEHSLGNDSYDQYKDLVLKEGKTPAEAEFRRQEAIDHDDKATTFAIAGGALFGAFLVQQLFFGGGGGDDQASRGGPEPAVALGMTDRQLRAEVVLARF